LLEHAAQPELGRHLRRGKIQRLLKSYRVRRVTADAVLPLLRRPPLTLAPGTVDAVTAHIQLLLPRVRLVAEQRAACERELTAVLADLTRVDPAAPSQEAGSGAAGPTAPGTSNLPSDVAILQSVPGVGMVVTATFLAEAWSHVQAHDYHGLRGVTGVAPVRRQTGKNKRGTISMRYACNHRLRNACYHWARVSTSVDAAARTYYAELRARGHSHGRALRSVADRWLRILVAMLTSRTLYDSTRFTTPKAGGLQPASPT
jgi:transposase